MREAESGPLARYLLPEEQLRNNDCIITILAGYVEFAMKQFYGLVKIKNNYL
jgi:hypothetical protein